MITSVTAKNWILAKFVRDDGQSLVLGDAPFDFLEKQQHFQANSVNNDIVELQGSDGVLLAGQVRRASKQSFDGYVGYSALSKSLTEKYRRQFFQFFAIHHKYSVIYVFTDGTAIRRQRGFIVDAPEVEEIDQINPEYHVALNFEDVNYYEYNEDANGNEIYTNLVEIIRTDEISGGAMWDDYGLCWAPLGPTQGIMWEDGSGGDIMIDVRGIAGVQPTITIPGPTINPTVENPATGDLFTWKGTVAAGQELIINTNEQTVTISGLSQIGQFEGDWLRLAEGNNRIIFTSDGGENRVIRVAWSEIVG